MLVAGGNMSIERAILFRLYESRLPESFCVGGTDYWKYKGVYYKCPSWDKKRKNKKSIDKSLYYRMSHFALRDDSPWKKEIDSRIKEEVPKYEDIVDVPEASKEDFQEFKSQIVRMKNNLLKYGDEGTQRKETIEAFKYVSSLMCKHKCDYETLRKKYKGKVGESPYHTIFQYVDSTLKHEDANNK